MADEKIYWPNGHIVGTTERAGVTTMTVKAEGRDGAEFTALLADRRDQQSERLILPMLRQVGGGRYAAIEDAMRRGALPGAVARDLVRLLRDADDRAAGARRDAVRDLARGRLRF